MLPGSAASEGEAGEALRVPGTPAPAPSRPPARGPPPAAGPAAAPLLAALGSGPGRGRRALRGALARREDRPREGADPGTLPSGGGHRRAVSPRSRAPPCPCRAPAVSAPGRARPARWHPGGLGVPEPSPRVPTRGTVLAALCQQPTPPQPFRLAAAKPATSPCSPPLLHPFAALHFLCFEIFISVDGFSPLKSRGKSYQSPLGMPKPFS